MWPGPADESGHLDPPGLSTVSVQKRVNRACVYACTHTRTRSIDIERENSTVSLSPPSSSRIRSQLLGDLSGLWDSVELKRVIASEVWGQTSSLDRILLSS